MNGGSSTRKHGRGPPPGYTGGPNRERLVFMQLNLVGRVVEVKKQNGMKLEGLFVGAAVATPPWEGCVVQYAKVTHVPAGVTVPSFDPAQRLKLKWKDLAYIHAKGAGGASMLEQERKSGFKTDTDISSKAVRSGKLSGRQLEAADSAWLTQAPKGTKGLHDGKDNGVWDQFKENKERFGVKSTYDENLYTTPLKVSALTPEQIRRAEETARDIEKQSTNNPHMREERGQGVWDGDEESRFSSVRRKEDGKPKPKVRANAKHAQNDRVAPAANKAYTPPHLRQSSASTAAPPPAQPAAKEKASAKPKSTEAAQGRPPKPAPKAWGGNRSFAAVLKGNDAAAAKTRPANEGPKATTAPKKSQGKPPATQDTSQPAAATAKPKPKPVSTATATPNATADSSRPQAVPSAVKATAKGMTGSPTAASKGAGGKPNGRVSSGYVAPRVNSTSLSSVHSNESTSSPKKDAEKMAAIKAQQIAEFHKFSSELESKGKAKQRAEEKADTKKDVKPKSKLNVAAKEWVPNAGAKEFRPRGMEMPPQMPPGAVPVGMPVYPPVVMPQPPMQTIMYAQGVYPQPSMGMQYYPPMPVPNMPPAHVMYNPAAIPPGAAGPPFDPNLPPGPGMRQDHNAPRPPPPPQEQPKK